MKRICILMFIILSVSAFAGDKDSLAVVNADWGWQTVKTSRGKAREAGSAQLDLFGSRQSISIVRYKARKFHTSVLESDGTAAGPTSKLAAGNGAVAAMNGSYFNMKDLTPETFVKDEGVVYGLVSSSEEKRCNGILRIKGKRGRKMDISNFLGYGVESFARKYREAIVSGPVLMEDGLSVEYSDNPEDKDRNLVDDKGYYSSFYSRRHPRTIMGYTKDRMVYLIVVDGRFPGQAEGMTVQELTDLCRYLGLHEAMNFDGGGSSTLWNSTQGVISHPCDNRRFDHEGERKIPNLIVVTD